MRRIAVVVLGAALLGSAAGASAGHSQRPMLRLTQAEPLSLRGLRFHGHERVRVRVNTESDRAAKRVIANRRGAFSVRFPGLVIDRCNDLRVTADGSFGSRATFKRPGLQCPPA